MKIFRRARSHDDDLVRVEGIPDKVWQTLHGPNDRPRVAAILEHDWHGRVLEIGSGRGYVSCLICRAHAPEIFVGAEPGPKFRAQSRALAAANDIDGFVAVGATGGSLPFPAGVFDRILVSEVLEHVHEPLPIMTESARALAPGGTALLTVPSHGALPPGVVAGHVQDYTRDEFEGLIARAGLRVEKHTTVSVFEFYLCARA